LSKKILLISGHGQGDSGAVGNGYKEANLTRELVDLLAIELKKYANVEVYDKSRDAFKDVKNGNFNVGKYDYALEIHFNAFNGKAHGSEIYVTTRENGITVEQEIMKNMKKYFTLRGVKREDFAVINALKNKGISSALLEVCFIDNANDMKVYQQYKKYIAQDIVQGISKGFGLNARLIEVGTKVNVSIDAKIGGLASNRGQKASTYLTSNDWEVKSLATHKGEKEALLSCNTWIAVKYLKAK
jgi:N-acetylmuramoyl-L-alanine amidase